MGNALNFAILVNGRVIAQRGPNDHVGEMAIIDPSQPRAATVVAEEVSVVCKLPEAQLAELGQRYPDIWRNLGRELSRRLAQRNTLVNPARDKIRVFVVSSVEALPIARATQSEFAHDEFLVTVWSNGVFMASDYPIESIEKEIEDSDFVIAIAQPDDVTAIRGENQPVPRDNTIFEIGLCIGRLGRKRTLVLVPRDKDVKLPSDLRGLTTIGYRHGNAMDLRALVAPACNEVRNVINDLGPRN